MPILAEYALTPDVFEIVAYPSDEVGALRLSILKEAILQEAVVRNLRAGAWLKVFGNEGRVWHQRGKELLRKLVTQSRLKPFTSVLPEDPENDQDWCREALASHDIVPLSGIVTTAGISECFPGEALLCSVDELQKADWWKGRSSSVRLLRTLSDYMVNLRLILECSNSLMLIDPHFDTCLPGYRDCITILTSMGGRSTRPLIEIHRVCYRGSGRNRDIISSTEWESSFKQSLSEPLRKCGLQSEVFIWDDFHDRYLISNLVGISVPNGFNTTRRPGSMTTWTRLGRTDRDDVQREFDPASNRHKLRHRFTIP